MGLLKKDSNALRHRNLMLSRVVWDAPFLVFSTAPLSLLSYYLREQESRPGHANSRAR